MKKILFLIILLPLLLTSCVTREELKEDLLFWSDRKFDLWESKIDTEDFILASNEFHLSGDDVYIHVKWTTNSNRITLTNDDTKSSFNPIIGSKCYNETSCKGHVNSFPTSEEMIDFTLNYSYKGVSITKVYSVKLLSEDGSFVENSMQFWHVMEDGNLSYNFDSESDVVNPGQHYSDVRKRATWDLTSNIVTGHIYEKSGTGGSAHTWVSANFDFTYYVYDKTLVIDSQYSIDISKNKTPQDEQYYKVLGIDMSNVISNFASILQGVNRYLSHRGQRDYIVTSDATWGGSRFFGNE